MTLQEYYGFPEGINASLAFYNFYDNNPKISCPANMSNAFSSQSRSSVKELDTSNVTDMESMFYSCSALLTIPWMDTSNVTNMSSMFSYCSNLVSLPAMYAGNLAQKFSSYDGFFGTSELPVLYHFGGLIDLKVSMDGNYSFNKCPNLTYESCINIIDGLYDFTKHGETPNSNQGRLKVGQSFLDKLTDEDIQKAIDKGWTLLA